MIHYPFKNSNITFKGTRMITAEYNQFTHSFFFRAHSDTIFSWNFQECLLTPKQVNHKGINMFVSTNDNIRIKKSYFLY